MFDRIFLVTFLLHVFVFGAFYTVKYYLFTYSMTCEFSSQHRFVPVLLSKCKFDVFKRKHLQAR